MDILGKEEVMSQERVEAGSEGQCAQGGKVSGFQLPVEGQVMGSLPPSLLPAPCPALVCLPPTDTARGPGPPDSAQGLSPLGLGVIRFHFHFMSNNVHIQKYQVNKRGKLKSPVRENQCQPVSKRSGTLPSPTVYLLVNK